MTALHRDLTAPEIWQRSFERSRHRRATAPKLRRQVVRRKRASTAMAAAMLAGPAAQFASAQSPSPSPSSSSGGSGIAAESPANRAIAGGDRAAEVMLQIGSAGDAVKAVQSELGVEANGVFDQETDGAVRGFQADAGLEVDGIVGPHTWGALFSGGTGPAASAPSGPVVVPSGAQSDDRTPVGNRTQFAVRMASADELAADEREKLGVSESSPSSDQEGDGGLVAIQFRAPESADEPEPSGDESDPERSTVSQERSSASAEDSDRGSDSPGEDAGRDDRDRAEEAGAGSTQPEGEEEREDSDSGGGSAKPKPDESKPEPREESKPRGDRGDAGSGSCSRKLVDPLKGEGTFSSGWRTGSRPSHAGLDFSAPSGTPIRAAACGVVNHISSNNGYGNFICVKHSSSFTTCYAHLSRFSDEGMGDSVRRGEVIGYVGSTGNSTGPHLHFETRTGAPYDRNDVDPTPYLDGREFSGTPVRSSSRGIGGPDLYEREPQPRQASTAQAAPSTEKRSAVAIATDRDESAPPASNQRGASVAAESEAAEPVAEKPADEPDAREQQAPAGGEAEAGDEAQPVQEAPAKPAAGEHGKEAPAESGSAEPAPQVTEEEPPVEETTSEQPAPTTADSSGAGEQSTPQGKVDGAESSSPTSEPASSNGSEPSTGEEAEEPTTSSDAAATGGDTSVEGESGSDGDDVGSTTSGGESSSADGTGTASVEAPAPAATTGSASANGSGQAESTTATAPSETTAASANGSSGATASGGSEASTSNGESASGAASSDASTEAYFSEDESDQAGAGD